MKQTRWWKTAPLVGVVLAALVALVSSLPGTATRYHRWQVDRLIAQLWNPGTRSQAAWEDRLWGTRVEQFVHHRDRLVELGALAKMEHTFQHVERATPAGRHLISNPWPPFIDYIVPRASDVGPIVITAWCEATDADAWRKFFAERDVPDYAARFIPAGFKVAP